MSGQVFGHNYAALYDMLYGDKDYEAECDLIEGVFRTHGDGHISTILDLGCGTGNHSIPLARRRYEVTGVDLSPEMLAQAQQKAAEKLQDSTSNSPAFLIGDARSLDLGRNFDAALMMFVVLGYQLTNDDVLATLRTVRSHLRIGGLFICDVWYGPAVLALRPSDRFKVFETPAGKLIRAACGTLDTSQHIAEIRYRMWLLCGQQLVSETVETHQVRYFFPRELAFYMKCSGLDLLSLTAFPHKDRPADDGTWSVFAIARAV